MWLNLVKIKNILLFLLTCCLSCTSSKELQTLEQLTLLQKEDLYPYLTIKNQFPWQAKEVIHLLQQSPKVQQFLSKKDHQLLIERFPTLEEPFFVTNIRYPWNGMLKRLTTFQTNAHTGATIIKTAPFSEAYEQGIFEIPLEEWEQQ